MKLDNTQSRPATAPARALKSRSASIEHLKSFWSNGHLQTPPHGSTADPAANMYQPTSARFPVRGESMKEQISQYLKTDRVVDAWDTVANKTGNCGRTLTKTTKGWPSSVFRAKPSDALRIRRGNKDGLSPTGLRRQMSWAQDEPEILNTYSFKRRPEISPRIHVVSVQMILDEDMNFGEDTVDGASEVGGDAGSIITALPSLSIQRPQTVDCAQG
ncbi:hypothetical protein N7470_010432 [Penicillium chermesinum]|nr:hypothetical protein N7470_010432 [Penicillium chermesinum]